MSVNGKRSMAWGSRLVRALIAPVVTLVLRTAIPGLGLVDPGLLRARHRIFRVVVHA